MTYHLSIGSLGGIYSCARAALLAKHVSEDCCHPYDARKALARHILRGFRAMREHGYTEATIETAWIGTVTLEITE